MSNCEICPILATKNDGKDVIVLETRLWRATLDANQQFLGKTFITLLQHKPTLGELDNKDWREFQVITKKLEAAVRKTFHPSHFNWLCLMNDAAMNTMATHVHWHLHPRYAGKVEIGGEIFEDTQWRPRKEKTDHIVSGEVLKVIADEIKRNLQDEL